MRAFIVRDARKIIQLKLQLLKISIKLLKHETYKRRIKGNDIMPPESKMIEIKKIPNDTKSIYIDINIYIPLYSRCTISYL